MSSRSSLHFYTNKEEQQGSYQQRTCALEWIWLWSSDGVPIGNYSVVGMDEEFALMGPNHLSIRTKYTDTGISKRPIFDHMHGATTPPPLTEHAVFVDGIEIVG